MSKVQTKLNIHTVGRVCVTVADTDRAERMGVAGRRRAVESFSWSTIGDRTVEVYREVLGR